MRIAESPLLDALCGEYLLGTLRGAARTRFERAVREDPRVALRLRSWERMFAPTYSKMMEVEPSAHGWRRLERELDLARFRPPWHRRLAVWRALAGAATAALVLGIALQVRPPATTPEPETVEIAQLASKPEAAAVRATASPDRGVLHLHPARPVHAGPAQSYELWLIPVEGGPPLSLAVLGNLEARVPVAPAHSARLVRGAKLAISVEPAGGSPTGGPTGPVILVGEIAS